MLRSRRPELKDFVNTKHPVLNIGSRKVVFCFEDEAISSGIDHLLRGYRRLPVVDRKKNLKGMISATDILGFLGYGGGVASKVSDAMSRNVYSIDRKQRIQDAIDLFRKHGKGAFPVLKGKKLHGIVTESDIVQQIHKPLGARIDQVMTPKPIHIRDNLYLNETARIMCRTGFRRLPVLNNGKLVGIMSPIDIVSHLNKKGDFRLSKNKSCVKEVMERDVLTISPDKDLQEAVNIMNFHGVGGIPVVVSGRMVGIITERDIVDLLG